MLTRITLLATFVALALPGAASAQTPTVSAPDVRPAAPAPQCTNAVPQQVTAGDVTIAVKADCSVTLTGPAGPLGLSVDGLRVLTVDDGTVVNTTISALGLHPARAAQLTFDSGAALALT